MPVQVDRLGGQRLGEPLGKNDLEGVAGVDVLPRAHDVRLEPFAGHVGLPARQVVGGRSDGDQWTPGERAGHIGAAQPFVHPVDPVERVLIGLMRGPVQGQQQHPAGRVVEDDQVVHGQEGGLRQRGWRVLGHRQAFEVPHSLVAQVAQNATVERGQATNRRDRPGDQRRDRGQRVTIRQRQRPWLEPDVGVAGDPAGHRHALQQEARFVRPAQVREGGDRTDHVGQELLVDRDHFVVVREFGDGGPVRHGRRFQTGVVAGIADERSRRHVAFPSGSRRGGC
jgi:hypothetical protein